MDFQKKAKEIYRAVMDNPNPTESIEKALREAYKEGRYYQRGVD